VAGVRLDLGEIVVTAYGLSEYQRVLETLLGCDSCRATS
jgi:hypothetical protein